MSAIQLLRAFVSQRLTVAVDEIIGVFERTICEYEEEIDRQRRLLGTERQPGTRSSLNIHTGLCQDIQPLIINTKIAPEQLQHIKEEPEESWSSQERQGFQGSDIPDFQFLPVLMKNEYVEEDPQLSQPHQNQTEENTDADTPATRPAQQIKAIAPGEDCRGLEATFDLDVAGFVKATSNGQFFLSQCFKTETEVLDGDWNPMIRSDQPFLDTRKDNDTLSHKTSHNQKKLYKCPACSKTFKHNTALQRHITCHTGEKPFDCTECGKTFRQKGSLHIHMRKHTGEKPFSCLVCGKNFTQSGTLAAHMRIHTGEKPFSCSVCKKRYNERGTLVRHMRVHTGEKPFTCSLCGKRFSEKGNLNKHKRIHTGEKPFSCMACEKKFSLLSHLKNHKCPGKKNSEAVEQELQLKCQKVTVQLTRHIV